ncbi:hypothetical protein Asp14428_32860 [Actinoplanes sp. NBRC 14428]|nr:hypothetical protein Asp14428_32860 [Actinoplanes sp. NBRC 14428]
MSCVDPGEPSSDARAALASRLRELREDAGLSTTRLAAELSWSQSKVSEIENRRTKPSVTDVQAWVTATGASDEVAAELMDVADSIQVASIIWDRTLNATRDGSISGSRAVIV